MFIKRYISLVIVVVAVASCSPSYVANSRNTPLFDKAGELAVSASYGFSGTEVQTAYAVTDHIAVMANANAKWSNFEQAADDKTKQQHFFAEAGAGYYLKTEPAHLEIFGGFGMGKSLSEANKEIDTQERLVRGIYNRIFIQPSVGTNNPNFNIIFTPRISLVNFRKFSPYPTDSYSFLLVPPPGYHMFFEPSLTGRLAMGKILFGYFQLGANVAFKDYYYYYNYSALNFSLGIQLRTSLLYKDGN